MKMRVLYSRLFGDSRWKRRL